MVQYDFPTLFADHNVVSVVIVNSTATVTPVANDEPEIEDADFILTEDDLDQESLELSESLNSSKNLKFGSMEASCLQFDVFNSPNLQNLKDVEIAVYLYFEEDSSSLFQVGIYLVNADKYEDDRSTRHITAYDLNFFLRDYDITDWYNEIYKTTAYWDIKHLRDDLFAWLAQEEPDLTIVQQVTTLVNDDLELEKGIESDVVTFGFFMSGILEANGVFGHVGRDGTYNYVALESYDKPAKLTITEDISLEPTQYENYHVWGIGYVAIYDRNNIRLAKEGSSAYKHPSVYNIVNSFVFSNNSNRAGWKETVQQAAQNLRDMITHMWYYPIENECEGNLCYEVGDRIDLVLEDYDEETEGVDDEVPIITNLYSYMLQRQFTGIQEFSDLITAKGDRKQPKYKVKNDRWHPGDSDKSTSGSGSGGISYVDSEHDRRLMQLLRNRGDRFLDEPSNVSVVYDRQNVEVAIKWTDPPNINTQQPHECEWAGTCVIRKEDSAPLNRWDGTLIVKSTTRDQYEVSAYVDDTIELNKKYYYAIMPYYIGLDDSSNSIGVYTWTKVVSVNTAVSMMSPLITGLQVYDVNVIATFEIPTLESGSYSYIKIVAKKGSIPTSKTDGIVKNLQASDTGIQFTGLDPESRYYFVIFASDGVTEVASDPDDCKTGLASYAFFEKLYTGLVNNISFLIGNTYNTNLIKDGVDISGNRVLWAKPYGSTSVNDINSNLASYIGTNKTLCAYMQEGTSDCLYYLSSGVLIRRGSKPGSIATTTCIPIKRLKHPRKLTYKHKYYYKSNDSYNLFYVSLGFINSSGTITAFPMPDLPINESSSYKTEEFDISLAWCDYIILQTYSGREDIKDIVITYWDD